MKHFADRLNQAIKEKDSIVCAGLDPRRDWVPALYFDETQTIYEAFYEKFLGVVGKHVSSIKPQLAFFDDSRSSPANLAYVAHEYGCLAIADAKRGDIGSTAEGYAETWLGQDSVFDALTVNPYLGRDSIEPFVQKAVKQGKGIFILVKTSNPGSYDFQDRTDHDTGLHIYELVANMVHELGRPHIGETGYSPIGAVVGATVPAAQVRELRARMPNTIFLMPGYGAQGASTAGIKAALDKNGLGVVAPSSRSLNFPWVDPKAAKGVVNAPEDWLAQIERAAIAMNTELRALRA